MGTKTSKPLTEKEIDFALEYLANGRNATDAYSKGHPKAKRSTCTVEGSKTLSRPNVAAFIKAQDAERHARLIMDADEALIGLTRHGRGDPRRLFKGNRLLPIDEWPDDAADCVKALKPGPFGTAITFYDKQRARELMAINGGKLRQNVDHTHKFDHAAYLGAEPPEGDD
jgi:hypothetical protein